MGLPDPLPVTVRPRTGEPVTSYLFRLAEANHLRPSILRTIVNDPPDPNGAFRLDRLAALCGRDVSALRPALTGLAAPRARPGAVGFHEQRKAAAEQRYLDRLARYEAIRADAQRIDITQAELCRLHNVAEDTVRNALAGAAPTPPGTRTRDKPAPTLDPVRNLIDQMHARGMSAKLIWTELVDTHHAEVSYPTVRKYLSTRRSGAADDRSQDDRSGHGAPDRNQASPKVGG